jgi:hypothetical protein
VNDWLVVRHAVAIAGVVTDAQTNLAVAKAQVHITAAPIEFSEWLEIRARQFGERWEKMAERPDRTKTAPDGHFHFLDLPNGSYSLTVSLPGAGSRYGTADIAVEVTRDAEGRINMAAADMALPPTSIKGQITNSEDDPILLAEVRLIGSNERTFSDEQGRYLLAGVEKGERTVMVAAQGYQAMSQDVVISQQGSETSLDFMLAFGQQP